MVPAAPPEKVISWLPAAHIAERGANYYTPALVGLEIHICPDPRRIVEFLPKVNPTWFFAVPRIWEKLQQSFELRMKDSGRMRGACGRDSDSMKKSSFSSSGDW